MNRIRNNLVGAILLSMLIVPMIIGVLHVPVGLKAITETDILAEKESVSKANSVSRPVENIVVTKENFLEHFTLSGTAEYNSSAGIVTLTPDLPGSAGSFTMDSQIDFASSFYLTGKVNLGNKAEQQGGADGMGFGFHSGDVHSIGRPGNGMGLAQLPNVFGFKLDTYFNGSLNDAGIAPDPWLNNPTGSRVTAFGAFVHSPNTVLTTEQNSMLEISAPSNNQFRDFYMAYDTINDKVKIIYDGQIWERDISTWHVGIDALSFIVSASTGQYHNLQQFEFTSMEYTPKVFEGNAVQQQVTLGESLATRDLQSFVTNVTYGDILLNPNEYNVTLKDIENDLVGTGKATVIVEHNLLGVRTEIEVPLDVRWGDTILAKGWGDLSVGAYTYHPAENKVTANQGTINSSTQVHPNFTNRYYSVNLYNLTSGTQKITDARNYVSHSVTGQVSPFDAINQFSNGTRVASTQVGDIIELTHEESPNRLRQIVSGQEQPLRTNKNTSFLELTVSGYQQLHFNLLNVKSNVKISKWTTNDEIDGMLGEFLTNSDFETVRIIGFSEYPDRSTVGNSIGKILVEESLSTGNKVQYEYEVNFEVAAVPESIEVSPKIATIRTGETQQLSAEILPENSVNTDLKWTSSNEELATVDEEGIVFGKRRGEVEISVETTNGLTDRATIQIVNIEIPSIDPSNPSLEVDKENPNEGSLAIRYASSLNFGETTVVGKGQELIALPSKDMDGRDILNMVTIQDIRPEAQRDGWQLQVRQTRELIGGSQIIMTPFVHESHLAGDSISVYEGDFIPNTDSQIFASASETNSNQIISFGMHSSEAEGVRLVIPPGMGVGNYDTTLEWNLVSGPGQISTDLNFEFSGTEGDSTASVTGYSGRAKNIVIPDEIVNTAAGWTTPSPVVSIGNQAFRDKQLKSVQIPHSVTSISTRAFRGNQLTKLILPDSLISIGDGAFEHNQLTEIRIPNSVNSIGGWAFNDNQLVSVEMSNAIVSLGAATFRLNPLEEIIVETGIEAERVKGLLTPSVTEGITELIKLRTKEQVYYQLDNLNSREWVKQERIELKRFYQSENLANYSQEIIDNSFGFSNNQSTGIYKRTGDIITIYVDEETDQVDMPNYTITPIVLTTFTEAVWGVTGTPLQKGVNVIDNDSEGIIHIRNTSNLTSNQHIEISFDGGLTIPRYILGETTEAEWQKSIVNKHPEIPGFELVGRQTMVTGGIALIDHIQDPRAILELHDTVVDMHNETSGLDGRDAEVHRLPRGLVQHLRHTIDPTAYMYAWGQHTGYNTEAMQNTVLNPSLEQWGIWHEMGHTYQVNRMNFSDLTEVTVNIYSMRAQNKLGQRSRLEVDGVYTGVFRYLESENKSFHGLDFWEKLTMFWQLELAFGDEFYPQLHRIYREERRTLNSDMDRQQYFIEVASRVSQTNLVPFFEAWGIEISTETKDSLEDYTALETDIWYLRDEKQA